MENKLFFKRTSLSTSNDIQNTLEYKMKSLQEHDMLVQEGLADYIGLSIDELELQRKQLADVIIEATRRDLELKAQIDKIKREVPEFMSKYGIDKLVGTIVSSITMTKRKEKTTKNIFVTSLTAKEKEEMIYDAGLGHYEKLEVDSVPAKIKVNKRKIALVEVVEVENNKH